MRLMRLKVSSVSFDFLIVSSILLAFSSAKAVKIGVMANPYLPTRREQEVAIRIAAQHFNSSSPLVLRFNETSDDPVETSTTAKDMVGWGAEVIIGIGTWPEVVTLARVGNASGVPILSLAEKTTGSNLLSTMPFLVQMSYPTYSDEVLCLANIISSYNWRRVIVIYEDDIYSSISSIATLFSDALQANGSKIDHHIVFPSMHTAVPNVAELVREKLQNIPPQLSKVFVVLRSSPQLANYLFMEAKEHNLMAADHVWIVSDDITDLLDSNFSQSFISSYMQGVIGIRTYFNQTTTFYQNFSIDFQKNLSNNNIEPRRLAVRAYDAIHVIANAVAARDRNKNITLWKGILTNNFLGLSGFINFSTIGTNLPQVRGFSVFRVLNVVGKSYKEIGYWSKGYGFYEDEEEMSQFGSSVVPMLRPILWPGHMGKIPKIPGGWGKLKIGVPNHTTFEKFVKVEYDDDSGMVKEPQGFCIEVFKEILKNLNYDLLYEWAPFHGSYDDLVNQVSLKKFDVAVGDITILAGRAVNVTFTVPFLSSGLSILVPIRPNHTPWMLTKPFTKEERSIVSIQKQSSLLGS